MDRFSSRVLLVRLCLLLGLIPLLGISALPHQASLLLNQAQRAINVGASGAASKYLASAAEELAHRPDLWDSASAWALASGDPKSAISHAQKAAAIASSEPRSASIQRWLTLGDAHQSLENLPAALEAWHKAAALAGPSSAILQRLWTTYLAMDNYPAAISNLQALLDLQDDDPQLLYQLGLLTATQHPQSAIDILEKAAELNPNYKKSVEKIRASWLVAESRSDEISYHLLSIGSALAYLEEWQHASEAFRQATLYRPDYAEAWAYLGEALQHLRYKDEIDKQERSKEALMCLQNSVALDPQSLAAHSFLALYWSRQDNYASALQAILSAMDADPQNPVLFVEKGRILAASSDLYTAHEAYQQAIDLAPNNPAYLRYLVEFSLKYNFFIEEIALPTARQAVILGPQDPANLDIIAQVLIRLGDFATAERFLLQALEINPNYAPAHLHLGMIYLFDDNKYEAMRELALARELAPDSPIDQQVIRLLETYLP